jgi:hypothetical protein
VTDRQTALRNIAVGDIFHGQAPNGASLICLALKVTETTIYARAITTQFSYEFDRSTGMAEWKFHGSKILCTIDSVMPLPADISETMLGLDRIYADKSRDESHQLTEDERRGLVFAAKYYPANTIAMPSPTWPTMSIDQKFGPEDDPEEYDGLSNDEKTRLILVNYLIPANSA